MKVNPVTNNSDARATADAAARRSYGKLVAYLASRTRDVAAAEDALAEAFAAALAEWPRSGCPGNPEGWLLTVARRKLIDTARHRHIVENATEHLKLLSDEFTGERSEIPDHRLAMIFACAHPAIDRTIRAPLILQVMLGVDAASIASAFLLSPAAMSQRLVRAKNKIRHAGIPFRIPSREELRVRLDAVLDAIYGAYAEGWTDAAGTDVARRELAAEAIYLGRLIAEMMPAEPEALGLLALMLHAEARRRARRNSQGEYVALAAQDPDLWDTRMIDEAESLLSRAATLGAIGLYQLEAALQSAHVYRRRTGNANWPEVVKLYDALLAITGSPVVAINRALAIAETGDSHAALAALDQLGNDSRLNEYQPYWATRAELLARLGDNTKANEAYDIAIGLERDPAVRAFLHKRRHSIRV